MNTRSEEIAHKRQMRIVANDQREEIIDAIGWVNKRIIQLEAAVSHLRMTQLEGKELQTYLWYRREVHLRYIQLDKFKEMIDDLDKIAPPLKQSVFRIKKAVTNGKAVWSLDVRYFDERNTRDLDFLVKE